MIIIASYSNVSVTYTADGTQTVFSFPFDYLRKAFVYVEVNEEAILIQGTDYSVSGKTVVFATAPASGTLLRIYRETDTTRLVSWADASVLKASDMTVQQVQELHILEEQEYWTKENTIVRNGHQWNARNFPIKNTGNPVDPKDATTKKYVDDELDTAIENLQLLADVVVDSEELQHITDQFNAIDENAAAAAESEANALSYKNSAATSATNAANSDASATATAEALTAFIATKETLTAPAVDTTLAISGAAADAKVTGIGIEEGLYPVSVLTWEQGGINSTTGAEEAATSSRTVGYTSTADADVVINNGSGANIFYYNLENGSYVYKTNAYITGSYTHREINKSYGFFRVRMLGSYSSGNYNNLKTYKNNKAITEINNINAKIQGVYQTPAYVASGGSISWVQTNTNMSITFPSDVNGLVFEGYTGGTYDIYFSDILQAASDYGCTVNDRTISGINYAIIYNIPTKTVSVVGGATYKKNLDEVILFRSYYGSYVSGLLVDYEIRRRYEATQNRITNLENAVNIGSTMPQYWLTYMQTKIADVQDKDVLVGRHGDSFVFITDIHYEFNDKNSPQVVKYVLQNSSVNRVVCGGDVISGGGTNTKASALAWLDKARNSFRNIGINPLYLRGNHDNNTEISPPNPSITISDSELYGILWKPIENEITMGDELNYYFDNPAQKIRYICLDTGHPDTNVMSNAQITWMQNRITELDSGWSVLVLTHQFYSTPPTKDENGTKIEAGLDAIYDSANATIIGVICGHSHRDYIGTSTKGYPIICTTCDIRAGEGGGVTRTAGTTTEQAFDVFHIDTANRMIYATRIGAGNDRSASF